MQGPKLRVQGWQSFAVLVSFGFEGLGFQLKGDKNNKHVLIIFCVVILELKQKTVHNAIISLKISSQTGKGL